MYTQGMMNLINKLLKKGMTDPYKAAMSSTLWTGHRVPSLGYAVTSDDSGHWLYMCERWPGNRRCVPVARFRVESGQIEPWFEINGGCVRSYTSALNTLVRVAYCMWWRTAKEQGITQKDTRGSVSFCRRRTPRYSFLNMDSGKHVHSRKEYWAAELWSGETERRTRTYRQYSNGAERTYEYDAPAPGALKYAFASGWIKVDPLNHTLTPLAPCSTEVGLLDHRTARRNGKALTEAEIMLYNFARTAGLDVREVTNALDSKTKTLTELQQAIDTGDLSLEDVAHFISVKYTENTKRREKFGLGERVTTGTYRDYYLPIAQRPIPCAETKVVYTIEELEAYVRRD